MKEAEIMTQQEAVAVAALYRRERDDVMDRLVVASLYCWMRDEEDENAVEQFTQRPGYQNGMKKLEPLN